MSSKARRGRSPHSQQNQSRHNQSQHAYHNQSQHSNGDQFQNIPLSDSDLQRGIILQPVQTQSLDSPPIDAPFQVPTFPSTTREELDRKWLPWFSGYVFSGCGSCKGGLTALCCCKSEDPAVPIRVLVNYLTQPDKNEDFPQRLPDDVVEELVTRADHDYDDWISYEEFVHLVLHEKADHQRAGVTKMIFEASIKSVTPVWYHASYKNCRPPPVFLPVVALVCIIVFVVYVAMDGKFVFNCPCHSPLIYSPRYRFEAWRWLTYAFVHGSWDHLLVNIIMMLFLGIPLEIVHKWHRILIIWFCGVIAGSLCHSMIDVNFALVGASGGVYALLAAHVANVILNYQEMLYNKIRIATLSVYLILDVSLAVYHRFLKVSSDPGETPVSHGAHLGGAITGVLLGLAILQNLKKRFYEGILWKVALGVYCVLVVVAILFNIFYPGFPKQNFLKYRQSCTLNTNVACPYGEQGGVG